MLLKSPAKFRYRLDHPEHKDVFDVGSAAHKLVLGVGAPIVVVDADSWRTKAAKAEADEARKRGELPVLPKELEQIKGMAAALADDPDASEVLGQAGRVEVSCFWPDPVTGLMLRCRFDKLPDPPEDGVLVVPVDYKTTASLDGCAYSVEDFGYHQSAALYEDILVGLGYCEAVRFVFVAQEKSPPYFPGVFALSPEYVQLGRDMNRAAIDLWVWCNETGEWPGPFAGLNTLHPRRPYASRVSARITEIKELIHD